MKKKLFFLLVFFASFLFSQSKDSIAVQLSYDAVLHELRVQERLVYYNTQSQSISDIQLCNWVNAYKKRGTSLVKRQLENRKTQLYFAKSQDLGACLSLKVLTPNVQIISSPDQELLHLHLSESLASGQSIELKMDYVLKLPNAQFTDYGVLKEGLLLKYFFIVPASFFKNEKQTPVFLNIEEKQFIGHWSIDARAIRDFKIGSNLPEMTDKYFEGDLLQDAVVYFSPIIPYKKLFLIDEQKVELEIPYGITPEEAANLEFYIPLQLKFLKDKLGSLPPKIYLDPVVFSKQGFFGIEDFNLPIINKKISYFSDSEKIDLNYFSRISHQVIHQLITMEKNQNHWFYNGLKVYLELIYIQKHYKNRKLLGDLSDVLSYKGIKPLEWTHLSKLRLSDRYFYTYYYILSQNLDQKVLETKENLSNFNEIAISHFFTGKAFFWMSQFMENPDFDKVLKRFIIKNNGKEIHAFAFLEDLSLANPKTEFVKDWFSEKSRVNLILKKIEKEKDFFRVAIKNNSNYQLPVFMEQKSSKESVFSPLVIPPGKTWFTSSALDTGLFRINPDFNFMEADFGDNQLKSKGLFSNYKKLQFKLYTDLPNPNFYQIFLTPQLDFNAYDRLLLGLRVSNNGLFNQKFSYSITPYYSMGTQSLKGSLGTVYQWMPKNAIFRNWVFGASGSYFNYDTDLTYKKANLYTHFFFTKKYRRNDSHSLGFSYNYFERDLNELSQNRVYTQYSLYNLSYHYSDAASIHEKSVVSNYQWMSDFQKISLDAFYRWEFAPRKKIAFRAFFGAFLQNETKSNLFNFGTSSLTNYSFSYNLLGQSAQTGVFSQQYVLAEGGFKSNFRTLVGQWISTTNVDAHLWKMFNVYVDAGFIKNKNQSPQFLYDTGVKLKVIPDFLEVFFPLQSSLGFEPGFKDYGYRIRYSLRFNLSSAIAYFRRGVY